MKEIELALTYDDVLLVPQYSKVSSRSLVSLKTKITPNIEIDFPVISINMDTVTGPEMAIEMAKYGSLAFYPRFAPPEVQAAQVKSIIKAGHLVIPAVGIKPEDITRVDLLVKAGVKAVTIDIAHGHLKDSLDFVKKIKQKYKDIEVISGVIATYEGARDLFESGADAVRVGVGPGTICTTRQVTGSGVPQITATLNAYKAGKEFNRPILTDGGTKNTGDIVKALAAGANAVVVGSQLAGCKESPGDTVEFNGKLYKSYNGSTSKTEKNKQLSKFSKDKNESYIEYVEGIESYVPYKGDVSSVLRAIEKGIRSGLSYSGAFSIDELHKNAQFIRVSPISVAENGAHGVKTTKLL